MVDLDIGSITEYRKNEFLDKVNVILDDYPEFRRDYILLWAGISGVTEVSVSDIMEYFQIQYLK